MKMLLLTVVLLQLTAVMSSDLTDIQWLTVGMCRAECVAQYGTGVASDSDCIDNKHCYMCWMMCERVHTPVWAGLCLPSRSSLCIDGCRLACDFTDSAPEPPTSVTSTFTEPSYITVASEDQLVIDWVAPVFTQRETSLVPVYVLFWRSDQQTKWKLACMTMEHWSTIDGPHRDYVGLSFRLLAVLASGPVAQDSFAPRYDTQAEVEAETEADEDYDHYDYSEESYVNPDQILISYEDAADSDDDSTTVSSHVTTSIVTSDTTTPVMTSDITSGMLSTLPASTHTTSAATSTTTSNYGYHDYSDSDQILMSYEDTAVADNEPTTVSSHVTSMTTSTMTSDTTAQAMTSDITSGMLSTLPASALTTTTSAATSTTTLTSSPGIDLQLNIKIEEHLGSLRGNVSWLGLRRAAVTPVLYTITWTRQSCQVHESLPECNLPAQHLVSMIEQHEHLNLSMLLPGLTYNSKYLLQVEATDSSHFLVFYTPRCTKPSEDLTWCEADNRFKAAVLPRITQDDLSAIRRAGQLPLFAVLAVCLIMGIVMVAVAVLLIRKQRELRALINSKSQVWKERAHSLRSSIRSRASSFRSSVRMGRRQYSPARTQEQQDSGSHVTLGDKKSVSFELDAKSGSPAYV